MPQSDGNFPSRLLSPHWEHLQFLGQSLIMNVNQYTNVKGNNFRKYKQIKGK